MPSTRTVSFSDACWLSGLSLRSIARRGVACLGFMLRLSSPVHPLSGIGLRHFRNSQSNPASMPSFFVTAGQMPGMMRRPRATAVLSGLGRQVRGSLTKLELYPQSMGTPSFPPPGAIEPTLTAEHILSREVGRVGKGSVPSPCGNTESIIGLVLYSVSLFPILVRCKAEHARHGGHDGRHDESAGHEGSDCRAVIRSLGIWCWAWA